MSAVDFELQPFLDALAHHRALLARDSEHVLLGVRTIDLRNVT